MKSFFRARISTIILTGLFLLSSSSVFAGEYCVKPNKNGLGKCLDSPSVTGESCKKDATCKPSPNTDPDFCEIIQMAVSCKDMEAKPGCCFCGNVGNAGFLSESICKKNCGPATAKWFQGSDCKDKAAEDYKKTAAAGGTASAAKENSSVPQPPNPLGTTDIAVLAGRIVNTFLAISGSLALVMFIYGGFLWITSGGAPDRIKQGRDTLIWTVLGIVLIFASYAIINFILLALNAAGG